MVGGKRQPEKGGSEEHNHFTQASFLGGREDTFHPCFRVTEQ